MMRPLANHLLVSIPERYTTAATPGKAQLVLPDGSDDWLALTRQIKAGENVSIETAETIVKTPVRQGLVLAVPMHLTDEMTLCTAPGTRYIERQVVVTDAHQQPVKNAQGQAMLKGGGYTEVPNVRTCADITDPVRVGEIIHFDPSCLTDEVDPGLYLVPYWAVIAVIIQQAHVNEESGNYEFMLNGKKMYSLLSDWQAIRYFRDGISPKKPIINPIGGYLLLSQVWPNDVEETEIEGRIRKVRYYDLTYANGERLIAEMDVPPLAGEGKIAWLTGSPLRGTSERLAVGDHVIFPAPARIETIAGKEYICVRQDEIMAVRTPVSAAQ